MAGGWAMSTSVSKRRSAVLAAPSSAAAITDSVSQNWAGYAVTGAHYGRVSGTWVVPAVRCTVGEVCGALRDEWGSYDSQVSDGR